MSLLQEKTDVNVLMNTNGFEVIGDNQRTIAFASIAEGTAGDGLVVVTAAGHALKKGQTVTIIGGAYAGSYQVKQVLTANTFTIEATWGATASGNLLLTASLNGLGFVVNDSSGLTIAEFEPQDPLVDPATVIAKTYVDAEIVMIPFKKIRITAGDITAIKAPIKAVLDYENR